MSALAKHILAMANDAHLMGHPEWEEIVKEARRESAPQSSWRRGEPGKDGAPIVAMGHITSRWADGASVDPFTAEIRWSKDDSGYEGWHYTRDGSCVAIMEDDEVFVHWWIDLPPEDPQEKGVGV